MAAQSVIVRVENSSAIPAESLHGRKEDLGRSLRLTVRQVLAREDLGEFSLSPRQGSVRAIFVSLAQNAVAARSASARQRHSRRRSSMQPPSSGDCASRRSPTTSACAFAPLDALDVIAVDSRRTMLSDATAAAAIRAAERSGMLVIPTLTYLANAIRVRRSRDPVFDDDRYRSSHPWMGRCRGTERKGPAPSS